jgi:hypothetical protein
MRHHYHSHHRARLEHLAASWIGWMLGIALRYLWIACQVALWLLLASLALVVATLWRFPRALATWVALLVWLGLSVAACASLAHDGASDQLRSTLVVLAGVTYLILVVVARIVALLRDDRFQAPREASLRSALRP